jgi:SAM-dependent methyltransferase
MRCRSCGGSTAPFFDLGRQPHANRLLDAPTDPYPSYPLEARLCEDCHLGQLVDLASPDALFREYFYYTSVSGPSVDAARRLVASIPASQVRDRLVVEIGSNDGYLLQFYQGTGAHVLGIDPARGPAIAAACRGISTLVDFFTADLARQLPQASIIHANNVLAHVPDLNDFVAGLAILLASDGVCYVEVPYLGDLLERCTFDTIYHEHAYYFSFRALATLFHLHGLAIASVEHLNAHGGSLRLCITRGPTAFAMPEPNLLAASRTMQSRMERFARDFKSTLTSLPPRLWGYGAAAKASVMLNYCGIDASLIDAIADETPAKVGRYIPGTGIPIRHPDAWLAASPSHTCIFAWNFAHVIAHRYSPRYPGEFFTPYVLPSTRAAITPRAKEPACPPALA